MSPSRPQSPTGDQPGIYFRFEMGLSWNPRKGPKSHQLTYVSRSMRQRANQFPRQLPPANTNFLAVPAHHAQSYAQNHQTSHDQPYYQHPQHQAHAQQHQQPPQQASHYYQSPAQDQHQHRHQPPSVAAGYNHSLPLQSLPPHEPERSSRSRSRSSHERGSSAPPPLNESPWDAEPEPMMATALPRRKSGPQVWKALPATPGQFRLGEDGMPWSTSSYPMGYVEDDEVHSTAGSSTRRRQSAWEVAPPRLDDRERGRVTEIESLATALMTVDNGFEEQWWYQGPRLVNVAGDLMSTAVMRDVISRGGTVGWAVADSNPSAGVQRDSFQLNSPESSMIDIVSPMSEFPSPESSYVGLRRSLTTRSEELHM